MKIRDIDIQSQVFLAPMAGYTDLPFRIICKEMGAAVVYSEFVSSEGLIRQSEKTEFYLINDDAERPFGIQIFGHDLKLHGRISKIYRRKIPTGHY